ncbi:MAG: hypothetical protein R2776_01265 [Flavobacteriaceae bacterium]
MPLNEQRKYVYRIRSVSFDQYGQNLFIGEDISEKSIFSILDTQVDYTTNKLSVASIEVPFEFRWRTSTFLFISFGGFMQG